MKTTGTPFIQIDYQVTSRCNARCVFCDCWKRKKTAEIPGQVWVDTARRLQDLAPVEFVCIGGGEPLLYDELPFVVKQLTILGFHTVVVTNGTLFSTDLASRLLDSGVGHIDFSVDGFSDIHNALRGISGLFTKCVKALESVKRGFPHVSLGLSSIICERNIAILPEFTEWALSNLPIDGINFQAYNQVTSYSSPDWWIKNPLWPKDSDVVEETLDYLADMARNGQRVINDPIQFEKFKKYFIDPRLPLGIRCPAGTFNFAVSHEGDIIGCIAEGSVGNIAQDDPLDVVEKRFAPVRKKAMSCTENCHFLVNCYFPLHWKRWSELMRTMVDPEVEPVRPKKPGTLVLPPEVRQILSTGPHDTYPDLIHLEDHRRFDTIGEPSESERRFIPPDVQSPVPVIYLCGDTSEVHRWGVALNENDFFLQIRELERLSNEKAVYHTVVGVRRTNFHRLRSIHDLIWKIRKKAAPPLQNFDATQFRNLRSRFEDYLKHINGQTVSQGIVFQIVDNRLHSLLAAVEKASAVPTTDPLKLLRALGPVCKDIFVGPRYLLLDLAGKCTLDCVYCRRFSPWNTDYWNDRHPELSGFMDLTVATSVIREASKTGVEIILLVGGGEPTLHPHFGSIIDIIRQHGMKYNFSTNGINLDRHGDSVLSDSCGAITVSLSFASERTFSMIRPNSSLSQMRRIEENVRSLTTLKKIRGLKGPEIIALYAISNYNVDEVLKMVHHAIDLGVDNIWYQMVHLEPFSKKKLFLAEDQIHMVRDQLSLAREVASRSGLKFHSFIDFEMEHYNGKEGNWSKEGLLHQGCYVGWHFAFVHIRREIFMCCGGKMVGYLDKDGSGFESLWRSEAYRRYRNDGLIMHIENPLTLYGSPLFESYCESCDNHDQNTMMIESLREFGLESFVER